MRMDSVLQTWGKDISTRPWHASLAFSPPQGCGVQVLAISQIQALFSLPSKSTFYTCSHEGRLDPWKPHADKQTWTDISVSTQMSLDGANRTSISGMRNSPSESVYTCYRLPRSPAWTTSTVIFILHSAFVLIPPKLGAINVQKMSQTTAEVWKDSYLRLRM